ncbi:MAG: ABC transporter substrate-binding protein [Candidatus Omnitrophota bacterium]|jgi:zinc transport system substrate-binding protein|nr:MAG: ABC transporter substrate-binding protein [Candidatus Omnitrophota bacterium]
MQTYKFISLILIAFFIGFPHHSPTAEQKIRAFVSILPQAYFVEQVGGEFVEVSVMVGPGQNPHTFEPTPKQMVALSRAQVYFRIGVPFETVWMDRLARVNPAMRIVDLQKGIPLLAMKEHHHEGEEHHAEHHDEHETQDPHIWLNPKLVKILAHSICDTLQAIDPDHANHFHVNLDTFLGELDALDQEIAALFEPMCKRQFLVFHPAWGYFADAYDLEQIPVELEGKEPTARQLTELIEFIKKEGIQVIFVQQQFSRALASKIAGAIDGKVITVDPLAKDYFENLRNVARQFAEALK